MSIACIVVIWLVLVLLSREKYNDGQTWGRILQVLLTIVDLQLTQRNGFNFDLTRHMIRSKFSSTLRDATQF